MTLRRAAHASESAARKKGNQGRGCAARPLVTFPILLGTPLTPGQSGRPRGTPGPTFQRRRRPGASLARV